MIGVDGGDSADIDIECGRSTIVIVTGDTEKGKHKIFRVGQTVPTQGRVNEQLSLRKKL